MLAISPTATFTLAEYQKTLAQLAEKLPEITVEGTAIKKQLLDLAKAKVVWKYIDARALRETKKDEQIFSLLEYKRLIYNLAMTFPYRTECSEAQFLTGCLINLALAAVPHEEEPWTQLLKSRMNE